jgi:unsaturated rhamnogalacturonyl hydrolase
MKSFKLNLIIAFIIFLSSSLNGFSQKKLIIQGESADSIFDASILNTDAGYTGSGFIQFNNTLTTSAVWMINVPESNQYTVTVRFANGITHKSMNVFVNNVLTIANLNFFPSGSWTTWTTLSFQVNLVTGLNDLKFVGSLLKIGPSIDYLAISNPNVDLEVAPVALNDTIKIAARTEGLISPLANDYDRNGDDLHIVSWTAPLHGTLDTMQGGKVFQYKPDQSFIGIDTINYTISDGINKASAKVFIHVDEFDWSIEMSNMIINNNSYSINWDYNEGLLLEGLMRVYKRTNDQRYLDFIKAWAEYHISSDGTIMTNPTTVHPIVNLDNIMPGFLVLHLYKETGIQKFKLAADKLRLAFDTYPRNPDSCFWHAFDLPGQLWLDGLYMGMPFLVSYGKMMNDETYAYSEAIRQFKLHIRYMKEEGAEGNGLLHHAYDVNGSESWAIPPYNRSPIFWGRAMGWVVMGLTEILDIIPENFPQRDTIVEQYKSVLKALANYQDPNTGLWYQVINYQSDPRNWMETSCSMMYVYSMSRAIQKGFLDASYSKNVDLGYMGVLTKLSEDKNKMVYLTDICYGTSVSADINYYFDRPKVTNDFHGLGSFLIMNELVSYNNMPWLTLTVKERKFDQISVYPNPCSDYVQVNTGSLDGNVQVEIFNISGMKLSSIQKSGQSESVRLDMSGFPKGIYLLRIQSNNQTYTEKLVRQ